MPHFHCLRTTNFCVKHLVQLERSRGTSRSVCALGRGTGQPVLMAAVPRCRDAARAWPLAAPVSYPAEMALCLLCLFLPSPRAVGLGVPHLRTPGCPPLCCKPVPQVGWDVSVRGQQLQRLSPSGSRERRRLCWLCSTAQPPGMCRLHRALGHLQPLLGTRVDAGAAACSAR